MTDDQQTIQNDMTAEFGSAPRVTPQDLKDAIASEHYFTAKEGVLGTMMHGQELHGSPGDSQALSLLTFCVLVLKNGFTVIGKSACVSPENFNAQVGREIAYDDALDQLWPLLGFALKERLHAQQQPAREATAA